MGTLTPTLDRQSLDWLLVLTSSVLVAARSAHPRKGGPHGTTRTASRDDRWGTRSDFSVAGHPRGSSTNRRSGAASWSRISEAWLRPGPSRLRNLSYNPSSLQEDA